MHKKAIYSLFDVIVQPSSNGILGFDYFTTYKPDVASVKNYSQQIQNIYGTLPYTM